MTYKQTLSYLYEQLPMFHRIGAAAYKADLDNTLAICKLLGNPETKFRSIHIAGTNGKGSCSHMLAAIYQQAGYKTGLYTSPHLKDFRERIKINGKPISQKKITDFVEKYKGDFEKIKPSFFEWTVGLAFDHFANEKIDIAIIEVGLGGRLDSTNVIRPLVSLITNIGYDHTALLGDTLEKIAGEKAGIIKTGVPVVIGEMQRAIKPVFAAKVKQENTTVLYASKIFRHQGEKYFPKKELSLHSYRSGKNKITMRCDLTGTYQSRNIASVLAVAGLANNHLPVSHQDVLRALKKVKKLTGLHGRWEVLNKKPRVICDTGHNKEGIKEVTGCVDREYKSKLVKGTLHVVWGAVNDKDPEAVLSILRKNRHFAKAKFYFCKPAIPRGLEAGILQEQAAKLKLMGTTYPSVKKALVAAKKAAAPNELVLVGGSTFVVAEVV